MKRKLGLMDLAFLCNPKPREKEKNKQTFKSSDDRCATGFDKNPPLAHFVSMTNSKRKWILLEKPGTLIDHSYHGLRAFVAYYPNYINIDRGFDLFDELENCEMGKRSFNRRKRVWSKFSLETAPCWTRGALLCRFKQKLEKDLNQPFDYVSVNRYADGKEYVRWTIHADEDVHPTSMIVSLSLGATRDFQFRIKHGHGLPEDNYNCFKNRTAAVGQAIREIQLRHGSLLVMNTETQIMFNRCLPKRTSCKDVRYDVSF